MQKCKEISKIRIENLQEAKKIKNKKKKQIENIMEELKDNVIRIAKENNLNWTNTLTTTVKIYKETIKVRTQDKVTFDMLEQIKKELSPKKINLNIQTFKQIFFPTTNDYLIIDIKW